MNPSVTPIPQQPEVQPLIDSVPSVKPSEAGQDAQTTDEVVVNTANKAVNTVINDPNDLDIMAGAARAAIEAAHTTQPQSEASQPSKT